jgi:hypothetical protein
LKLLQNLQYFNQQNYCTKDSLVRGEFSNWLELDVFLWIICVAICKNTNNRIITKKKQGEIFLWFFSLEPQYKELETSLMVKMNPFPSLGQFPTLRIPTTLMNSCSGQFKHNVPIQGIYETLTWRYCIHSRFFRFMQYLPHVQSIIFF